VPGRASGVKWWVWQKVGEPISHDGVAVHPDCWFVCLCYLYFAPEYPEDGEQRYDIWVLPRMHPRMPTQIGGEEMKLECSTTWVRVQGCVNDDLRADGLQKGWGISGRHREC